METMTPPTHKTARPRKIARRLAMLERCGCSACACQDDGPAMFWTCMTDPPLIIDIGLRRRATGCCLHGPYEGEEPRSVPPGTRATFSDVSRKKFWSTHVVSRGTAPRREMHQSGPTTRYGSRMSRCRAGQG